MIWFGNSNAFIKNKTFILLEFTLNKKDEKNERGMEKKIFEKKFHKKIKILGIKIIFYKWFTIDD